MKKIDFKFIAKFHVLSLHALKLGFAGLGIAGLCVAFTACSESFTDSRDGHTYSTAKIGNQTWMAENLAYEAAGSACPDGENKNCSKFGRLYPWEAAKSACPEGWRLPSKEDFEALVKIAGNNTAGAALKASSGWFKKGNGSDEFGFAAMPAGFKNSDGKFDGIGGYAHFWSATVDSQENTFAYFFALDFSSDQANISSFDQGDARSVRCIK